MSAQAITLHLPSQLFEYFQSRAEQTHRSVETELLKAVAASVPQDDDLPPELTRMLADLATLEDSALWRAAQDRLPADAAAELESLNLKQQREGLTSSEKKAQSDLIQGYERVMLIRAEAAWLLKQRGHDVSMLIP